MEHTYTIIYIYIYYHILLYINQVVVQWPTTKPQLLRHRVTKNRPNEPPRFEAREQCGVVAKFRCRFGAGVAQCWADLLLGWSDGGSGYPLVMTNSLLLEMTIELVDFPSYKMVDLSIAICMFTRAYPRNGWFFDGTNPVWQMLVGGFGTCFFPIYWEKYS